MLKYVRVNAKTRTLTIEDRDVRDCRLGGRALVADLMLREVNPLCDPLGPENKVIFCTPMLAGSGASTALRLSVGAKSPLTNGIKEANVGGTIGAGFARANIKAIIVEDKPDDNRWHYVFVDKMGEVSLVDCTELAYINNYEFVEQMNEKHGAGCCTISIGSAGARQYKSASLQVTDATSGFPSRAAARGGLGAVLGSKQIKGIVCEKSRGLSVEWADNPGVTDAKKKFMDSLMSSPVCGMSLTGTIFGVDGNCVDGIIPSLNYSGSPIRATDIDKVGLRKYLADIKEFNGKQGVPCQPGCVIRCSNVYNGRDGNPITAALEYETIGLFGPNLGTFDLEFIAHMDHICDDIGVDTIEVGGTIGVIMEAGKMKFGDIEGVKQAMKELTEGTEFGALVGNGSANAGKTLGVKRVPEAMGQNMAAYDPRSIKGFGVTYSLSAMGADHTAGIAQMPGQEHLTIDGKLEYISEQLVSSAVADSLMCLFGWYGFFYDPKLVQILVDLINPMYGLEWTSDDLYGMGRELMKKEYQFNELAGIKPEDYHVNRAFYEEKHLQCGTTFDLQDDAKDNYIKQFLE